MGPVLRLMQPATRDDEKERSRILGKVAASIGGYDIFISYRHASAQAYAVELERRLESRGLMVFRDESEEDAGSSLETFVKRACAARTFVILVTDDVYYSSGARCQRNVNWPVKTPQSLWISGCQLTPLSQGSGAIEFEGLAIVEVAFVIEMIVD